MAEVVDAAPVGEKGQVTIPKQVRNFLDVKPGDRVIFVSKDREIVMKKSKSNQKLSEILSRGKPVPESSISFQRKLRQEWKS
jgi:AbrB family looped-hinge helix DNA binding protein